MGKVKKRTKFSNADKINLRFNILNLLLTTIIIGISIWSILSNERIAKESGVFEKSDLQLFFGKYELSSHFDDNIDIYYNIYDTSFCFTTLPIIIYNSGNKTVQDVQLIFSYQSNNENQYKGISTAIKDSITNYESIIGDVDRKLISNIDEEYVLYPIRYINPKLSVSIDEIFAFNKHLTDAYQIFGKYRGENKIGSIIYPKPITVKLLLTSKDMSAKSIRLNINFRTEKEITKLAQSIVKEKLDCNNGHEEEGSFYLVVPKDKSDKGAYMNIKISDIFYCEFDKKNDILKIDKNGNIHKTKI